MARNDKHARDSELALLNQLCKRKTLENTTTIPVPAKEQVCKAKMNLIGLQGEALVLEYLIDNLKLEDVRALFDNEFFDELAD